MVKTMGFPGTGGADVGTLANMEPLGLMAERYKNWVISSPVATRCAPF